MRTVSRRLDRVGVLFDDESLVATPTRLDLEALINATVRLVGHRPGRKVMTLVHAIIVGGSHKTKVRRCIEVKTNFAADSDEKLMTSTTGALYR